jgi:oxygen-independent coproporphyrinogen-3 oxidase
MGAASQCENKRFVNHERLQEYLDSVNSTGNAISQNESFEPERETIILGLRQTKGIDMRDFQRKFSVPVLTLFPQLKKHLQTGLLEESNDFLRLTKRGLDLANVVWMSVL